MKVTIDIKDWVADVRQFQLTRLRHNVPMPTLPTVADEDVRASCIGLIYEESREVQKALVKGDLVGTIDGVADLIYIAIGVAMLHGVDIAPIFAEVHDANMRKKPATGGFGRTAADGSSTKEGWEPPRIAEHIMLQAHGRDD